jgi:hypothetical protein
MPLKVAVCGACRDQGVLEKNNLLGTVFFQCGKHYCWVGAKRDSAHNGEWMWVDGTSNTNLGCAGRLWNSAADCVYVGACV